MGYTLVMYLLIPVILYRLAIRGLRAPAYFKRWRERFGFFPKPDFDHSIWVHAVSVGEVNAAVPLIRSLMAHYPGCPFVVTTVTPTGSERLLQVFGDQVFHVYLPYDLPAAIQRFLDRVNPQIAVIMETELWPNLLQVCYGNRIPIVIANARLSERSLRGYRPVQALAAMALNCASHIAAQTHTDENRLLRLGGDPDKIDVVGSLKFDLQLSKGLEEDGRKIRSQWGKQRFVFIAASTHEDDEGPILETFAHLLQRDASALLVIAPRHPERFARVVSRCRSAGLHTAQRSVEAQATAKDQCFVVDTLGELMRYYAASDLAFVGGSLAQVGGHNVLEPAALGVGVLVGPHTFNFSEITELLLDRGGAARVHSATELTQRLLALHADRDALRAMGQAGFDLVQENRGALERTLALVEAAAPAQLRQRCIR